MSCLYSLTLIVLSLASSTWMKSEAQGIKSAHLLDLVIRDYTFRSYDKYFRTGMLHTVDLPANLSGIGVNTVRYRCGSLQRYGARVEEFHLGSGVIVHPCVERVMVVRQKLGYNWSSIYYDNYELSGYQLVSPVLGLLAYNGGDDTNFSNPFELRILAGKSHITIDFSNTINTTARLVPICASFERDGKVTLSNQVSPNVCVASGHGHFGMVIESPLVLRKKVSGWKLAVGTSIGAALGAILLGLLLIALFVKGKKKARMEEMERRAYEEEALQVSMVGHVRAPTAPVTRTLPTIEHEYRPPPPPL
uniref:Non-specific serine/threonine protein kinase n=1 Tax=Davidia involucrata TaxID=16924 RepID=A0A5B7CHA2_DAVIN